MKYPRHLALALVACATALFLVARVPTAGAAGESHHHGATSGGIGGAVAASTAAAAGANSALTADGKIRIKRSEIKKKARKAYFDTKAKREKLGIKVDPDELKRQIRAAIVKKYEIEEDETPTPASLSSAAPPDSSAAPPDPSAAPPDPAAASAAAEAAAAAAREEYLYTRSRDYDNYLTNWRAERVQKFPANAQAGLDAFEGLPSEYNRILVAKWFQLFGTDLNQIWSDIERAKGSDGVIPMPRTSIPVEPNFVKVSEASQNPPPQPRPDWYRPPRVVTR